MILDFNDFLRTYQIPKNGVIHVGIHHGEELGLYLSNNFDKIDLIEPCQSAIQKCKEVINNFGNPTNIKFHETAVGNEVGKKTMYIEQNNLGQSNSFNVPNKHKEVYPDIVFDKTEEITITKLDNIIENKEDYNVLVMDVQSFELEVLKGATETLKHINVIYTEINYTDLYTNGVLVDELDAYLLKFGFVRIVTGADMGGWSDAAYIREDLLNNKTDTDNENVESSSNPFDFNEADYLLLNPDVANAVKNGQFNSGREHYDIFGHNENRQCKVYSIIQSEGDVYVKNVPSSLQMKEIEPYPIESEIEFEYYFMERFIKEVSQGLKRVYLPIMWTSFQRFNNNTTELNIFLKQLDPNVKYFTICQHDDGILADISHLDILVFASGCSKPEYYPIPLIYKADINWNNSNKSLKFSFIGSNTHPVRSQLAQLYPKDVFFNTEYNRQKFITLINYSTFSLCPCGYGVTSFRIMEALACDSIPVYISDTFIEPFNIPFEKYGIKVQLDEIENLQSIMDNADIKKLRENGKDVYNKYFTYEGCYEQIINTVKQ